MKNKLTIFLALSMLLAISLGCGIVERFTGSGDQSSPANRTANQPANQAVVEDKTTAEKAVDLTLGEHTLGIPECDALFDALVPYANSPEDNFVTRAGKRALVNKIRQSVKESIEQNKNDKTKLANDCKEYKTQLDNFQTL